MSYGKTIGFGINPDNRKAAPGAPHPHESVYFESMGVKPIFIDLKPLKGREPEGKIFPSTLEGLGYGRILINNAKNAGLIVGQTYQDKSPITSIMADTSKAVLDQYNRTLRYREETCMETGISNQGDFNEKSGMKGGKIINGMVDRVELERERRPGETMEEAYNRFIQQSREQNTPSHCDTISFKDLRVAGGYQCARNEIGVFFKHPRDNVMFVFEMCEDIWHSNQPGMRQVLNKYYELEFEVKQMWGELPSRVRTKEDFKEYVYGAMSMFRDYLQVNVPGAVTNMKSKAEIMKEDLERDQGITESYLRQMGLRRSFEFAVTLGGNQTLAEVLEGSKNAMFHMARNLHDEKLAYNRTAIQPSYDAIGKGTIIIPYSNDNPAYKPKAQQPVAALA